MNYVIKGKLQGKEMYFVFSAGDEGENWSEDINEALRLSHVAADSMMNLLYQRDRGEGVFNDYSLVNVD